MITITRNLARQVRAVFRRTLAISRGGLSCAITFQTGPDGLRARAQSSTAAVEYHVSGDFPIDEIAVPLDLLADCEGRKEEPVKLTTGPAHRVHAQWRDGSVPQIVQYQAEKPVDHAQFPWMPEKTSANRPGILQALRDASDTCDPTPGRFATDHLQLRGSKGTIGATDGRQMLVQLGFGFPWEDDVLVPANRVFGSPEFQGHDTVIVGRSEKWFSLAVGPWTIHLPVGTGMRFPELDDHIPRPFDASASCRFCDSDAQFLLKSLPKLPGDLETNLPVTLDLNGQVFVRAQTNGEPPPTELVLSNSQFTGEPIRLVTNRKYLARAIQLGFDRVYFHSPSNPMLCEDEQRRYVWAVLDPESAIAPAASAVHVESSASSAGAISQKPRERRKAVPMSQPQHEPSKAARNGHSHAVEPATAPPTSSIIEQAIALRGALQQATVQASALVRLLKQDKRQARQLRTALASLREIQTLEV